MLNARVDVYVKAEVRNAKVCAYVEVKNPKVDARVEVKNQRVDVHVKVKNQRVDVEVRNARVEDAEVNEMDAVMGAGMEETTNLLKWMEYAELLVRNHKQRARARAGMVHAHREVHQASLFYRIY